MDHPVKIMEEDNERSEARDHISLEVERHTEDDHLVCSIKDKMETISSSPSICRVSEKLCKENKKAYIPEKVSIGPFHHGKEALVTMEDHKWHYLYALLNRKPNLESSLDTCVKALRELEHRARLCYRDKINFNSDKFVQMMLVDGCFIIEVFLKYSIKGLRRRSDFLFSTQGMLYEIRSDMMMLENQIPFFVLQRLFDIVPIPKQCTNSLTELAFSVFKNMLPAGNEQVIRSKFGQEGHHLLDLIHNCFLPTLPKVQAKQSTDQSQKHLDPAKKLREKGIRFKKASAESLLNIKFFNGVLEIPPLKIHQFTENLLRNLIALEECYCGSSQPITSYAFFMCSLVSSERDVKLLRGKQILINWEEDKEKKVSVMFKKLCQEVVLKDHYYEGLCERLIGYKKGNWSWRTLKPSYLRSPLSIVLFFVAILVLLVTFVGSFLSVVSFSLHHF